MRLFVIYPQSEFYSQRCVRVRSSVPAQSVWRCWSQPVAVAACGQSNRARPLLSLDLNSDTFSAAVWFYPSLSHHTQSRLDGWLSNHKLRPFLAKRARSLEIGFLLATRLFAHRSLVIERSKNLSVALAGAWFARARALAPEPMVFGAQALVRFFWVDPVVKVLGWVYCVRSYSNFNLTHLTA